MPVERAEPAEPAEPRLPFKEDFDWLLLAVPPLKGGTGRPRAKEQLGKVRASFSRVVSCNPRPLHRYASPLLPRRRYVRVDPPSASLSY